MDGNNGELRDGYALLFSGDTVVDAWAMKVRAPQTRGAKAAERRDQLVWRRSWHRFGGLGYFSYQLYRAMTF